MGNALQAQNISAARGFLGSNPLEDKFAAIDKGIEGINTWKTNIEQERLDLKKNTAQQIREAEKYAYENMPNDETAKARILADLAKYKDQMLTNEKLVRNGAIPPEENLIFFENGKQTFEIYADMVKNFDAELTKTKQRAEGYYTEDGTFVPPVSGDLEAIKQQIQTQIGTLSGIETNFTEKGMGNITFFQMEVDPTTNTFQPKRDADGNKIPLKGTQPNMSVLALSHKANTRANRVYINDIVSDFNDTFGKNYQVLAKEGGLIGNVITDATKDPNIKTSINAEVASQTTNIENVASLFSKENGLGGQLVSFTQWDNLSDDQKNEKISVTILDENLEEKTIQVNKYVKVAAANQNNAIVPEMSEDQIKAAQGHLRKAVVDGLQRTVTKGTSPPRSYSRPSPNEKSEKNKIILLDEVVRDANETSLTALVNSTPGIASYELQDDGTIVFVKSNGDRTNPINVKDGAAKDAGTLLASVLGIDPNEYKSKSKVGDISINTGVIGFENFAGDSSVYSGDLNEFVFGKKGDTFITSSDLLNDAKGRYDDLSSATDKIKGQAQQNYGVDLSGFELDIQDTTLGRNVLLIKEDGKVVKEIKGDRLGFDGFTGADAEINKYLNRYIQKKIKGGGMGNY